MLMMRTIKPLMSQRADSGGTCPLAILERRMAEHLRSRSLQPTPGHYQASSTMTKQLPKPPWAITKPSLAITKPLPNPFWPLPKHYQALPRPRHYQARGGHYQAIIKPSLAITNPLPSPLAITKPTLASTKPFPSAPWPSTSHYQALRRIRA